MKKHIVALIMVLALLAAVIPMQALAAGSALFPSFTVNKGASTNKIEKGGSGQVSLTIEPSRRSEEYCSVDFKDSEGKPVKSYWEALKNTTASDRDITVEIDTDAMSLEVGKYTVKFWIVSKNQSTGQYEYSEDSVIYEFEVVAKTCDDGHDLKKTSEVKATCSKKGSIKYTCRDCGHVVCEETEMTDHEFKLFKVNDEPTPTTAGEGLYKCSGCELTDIRIIPISAIVKITSSPKSTSVALGKSARFTVVATGEGLTYQWQRKLSSEADYSDIEGATKDYYTVSKNQDDLHESKYRCIVTDVFGNSKKSSAATLRVAGRVSITTQPKDAWAYDGQTASVKVTATGDDLEYQWYYKPAGASDFTLSSKTTATYSTTMNEKRDGYQVYCVVTDGDGISETSETVTLTTRYPAKITKHPSSVIAYEGDTIAFTVVATGDEDEKPLEYQWYFRDEGKTTWSKSACTEAVYSTTLTEARDERQVYCKVTDQYGNTVSSKTATMKLVEVNITKQPKDAVASAGDMVTISVEADGVDLKYQWYYKNAGSSSWTKSSVKTADYTTEMTKARHGRQVYCVVTDKYGEKEESKTATMTLPELKITKQPKSANVFLGDTVTVSVVATGDELSYQWYYKNAGSSSYKESSTTEATYSTEMTEARDGRKVYCVVRDAYGRKVTSNTVTLSVKYEATITSQPKNRTKDVGETATFTVKATGDGLKYQWYYRTSSSGSWKKASSTSSKYSVEATMKRNGYEYYCEIKDKYGNVVNTNTVSLTVN